jgi:choline dehydrogenase-like flavoprotein
MSKQTSKDFETVDFVIVSSGAASGHGAGTAGGGFTVVVLEQGPRLSLPSFKDDELKDQRSRQVFRSRRQERSDATRGGDSSADLDRHEQSRHY